MPVGVAHAQTAVDILDAECLVADRAHGRLGVVGSHAEVDVDTAAGVGEPQLWLPQLQVERAGRRAHAFPFLASVDDLEAECAVELDRPFEVLDFEDDLEDPVEARAVDVALAEFNAVALGVVEVKRARVAERLLDEVELLVEAVVPGVVLRSGDGGGVVGVQAAARDIAGRAQHEVGLAGRERDLALGLSTDLEVEKRLVERLHPVEILHFQGEPPESIEHVRTLDQRTHDCCLWEGTTRAVSISPSAGARAVAATQAHAPRAGNPLSAPSLYSTMQTVILAAGKGTRMRPLTETTPKPMLPVAAQPLVAHAADAAVDAGASELVLVVGYEGSDVREFFGETYRGVPVTVARQERQRGTADAVRAARDHLDGPFAVLNGDNLYDPAAITELFDRGPALAAMTVKNPTSYGVVSVDDGRVTAIVEKPADPPSSLANAGAYVFPAAAQDWLDVPESERGEYELTDVVAQAIERCEVSLVRLTRWLDVGRPWELLEANEWKLDELERDIRGDVADDATLRGSVVVESGATVEPGAVIEGPALVRAGAHIGPNAYVRGRTLLGADVHVGHSVEVKNSVVMAGTNVPHLSYVGDSVVGRNVNFGAGTTVANLRHDDRPVRLTVKGERVSTGRRKFGVVVGDGAKTGINTSLNAGVTLSPGATTAPGESVTRDR